MILLEMNQLQSQELLSKMSSMANLHSRYFVVQWHLVNPCSTSPFASKFTSNIWWCLLKTDCFIVNLVSHWLECFDIWTVFRGNEGIRINKVCMCLIISVHYSHRSFLTRFFFIMKRFDTQNVSLECTNLNHKPQQETCISIYKMQHTQNAAPHISSITFSKMNYTYKIQIYY